MKVNGVSLEFSFLDELSLYISFLIWLFAAYLHVKPVSNCFVHNIFSKFRINFRTTLNRQALWYEIHNLRSFLL